jgi:hypothetical protein
MAQLEFGKPFGIDLTQFKKADWELAVNRVLTDMKTDFIWAPHLRFVFRHAPNHVIGKLKSDLQSGKFFPAAPLSMEVPKTFRLPVRASGKARLGPSVTRPGSILLPPERLFYQLLADKAAPVIDEKTDKDRSFSHWLADPNDDAMFQSTRRCWSRFQTKLTELGADDHNAYVMKLDIASYFGSINQHKLMNVLQSSGLKPSLCGRLELLLTYFAGDRSSRGLLQGMFPSDLFGNFYLDPLDRLFSDLEIPSARYVDDIYLFIASVDAADNLLRLVTPKLRAYGLVINEQKSKIVPKAALATEEPDLQKLFEEAVREIAEQIEDDEDFEADYGFQSEFEDDDEETETPDLNLEATKKLFDSIEDYPGQEENIERFCLPLFAREASEYALYEVTDSWRKRPAMAQMYASYVARFIKDEDVKEDLVDLLASNNLHEWQQLWIIGAMTQAESYNDAAVKTVAKVVANGNASEALRAIAANFVGRFGDHTRRDALREQYASLPEYVRGAVFYASRNWPAVEKGNAKALWSQESELHKAIAEAMANA